MVTQQLKMFLRENSLVLPSQNRHALMFSLHGMRVTKANPATSITSITNLLVVMIKNPFYTVKQVTALSILAQTT